MKIHSIYKNKEGKKKILDSYEQYLETFSVDFERMYISTRFGKTHVLVTGPSNGKPIFIFQGGNCINPITLSWFSELFQNYRIYAPDTPGHPGFSDEFRMSGKDESFALWIADLMEYFQIEKSSFIGPSYGAGIILRLATFLPKKMACSVLVSPAGIKMGSKLDMIRKILVPLSLFHITSNEKHLKKISDVMSLNSMKNIDHQIISEIFKSTKLEQDMPKLTDPNELLNYTAPTLLIAGDNDIFFPEKNVVSRAKELIPNSLTWKTYEMGHFPSTDHLKQINQDIIDFLQAHY
ncbi:alpha/beta fold hydrolase [Evansella tamaricis]|uniref:Alpha/beta hydrolase n=1 Tax=Evansella tamaricis TaxID=2069301 RepID=A0ABS6JJR9_9BACI|nr:alpha/beta hydrolase [Evansella tamaricis]MBU9713893.1 alpha/beta hydrolase [Evansella tamaricis]